MLGKLTIAAVALMVMAPTAHALPAVGTTPDGLTLVRYDTDAPGTILERHAITGLQADEKVMGLDVRPATGQLYALGIVRGAMDAGRLYVIDPGTGAATQVGTAPFKTDLTSTEYGFDFNPVADRVRVVNRGENNLRVSPDTGVMSPDDPLNPAGDVDAIGYDQNVSGTTQTTLWGYDSGVDKVVRIGGVDGGPPENSPNAGKVVSPFAGGSGVATAGRTEMDFAANGRGFVTAQTAPTTFSLFTLNLSNGTLTLVASFPEPVEDIALLQPTSLEIDGRFLTVSEDGINASIEVRRFGNVTGTQTVAYSTSDGTAGASDYTPTSGTITFGPNEAVTAFNVPITDDTTDEPAEKFTVTLSAPTGGAALGSTPSTEVTILDNDPVPSAADKVKPQLLLSVPSSLLATTFGRGLKGSFSCSEQCTTRFTMKLGKRTIGKATKKLSSAGKGRFTVKLSKAGKKTLRKALKTKRKLSIALSGAATDAAGNRGTASARVAVTRSR